MLNETLTIELDSESGDEATRRAHRASAAKNWAWLESHWPELLPGAYGKFLAVAGQEAFLADSVEAALQWARSVHPEDTGHIVEYVWPPHGPRIYSGRTC